LQRFWIPVRAAITVFAIAMEHCGNA